MKTAAVLSICLTLAIVQDVHGLGSGLQIFQKAITRLKTETSDINRDLRRLEKNVVNELDRQLNNMKYESMTNINQAVNSALSDIRAQVDKAKEQGKDVERCYENARVNLRSTSQSGFDQLDQCVKRNKAAMDPVVKNINNAIAAGENVMIYLDSIFIDCFSSASMETCVAMKMPSANANVKNLRSTYENLQSTANSITRSASNSGRSCMFDAVSNTRNGILQARLSANACVDA